MKNNQKGITLVALVITIIVLLILAGVSISSLSGDNGILVRAKDSKVKTNITTAKELISRGIQEGLTDFYNDKYATSTFSISDATVGAYLSKVLVKNTNSASAVVTSVTGSGTYTITTNVKGTNGNFMTATMNADGKITGWANDN